jgi:hypothetical protein
VTLFVGAVLAVPQLGLVQEMHSQMHMGIRIILIMFLKLPQKTIKCFCTSTGYYNSLFIVNQLLMF